MIHKSLYNFTSLNRRNPMFVRLCHKIKKQSKEKPLIEKPDVIKYLESSVDYVDIKDQIPRLLLRKYKAPENMYLINRKTAIQIIATIKNLINWDSPIIEVNPGFGFITEELLKSQKNSIYMYETYNQFAPHLSKLQDRYPGRTILKFEDFFGMWKLAFQDKMDGGNRVEHLLGDLCTKDALSADRSVNIIGSMPGLNYVKHLINNIIFHNTTNQLGRPDLFITMPGHHYELLTDRGIQHYKKNNVPTLFQILFNFKVLTRVPKVHFLPWIYNSSSKAVSVMDEHMLYLVNITQKEKLPCPSEYLPLMWYFFKPHMFSKSTRVIPMLEQWIPGCGVWLITGQDPPDTNIDLAPQDDDEKLPHMTIFTEFGDLNLKQKITLFKKFISWPEFEQCQFRVTMENNLPKFINHYDDEDDKKVIGSHMEDIEHTDIENETQ